MAAVTCKYHTSTPALWRCEFCQINYCPGCVKQTSAGHAPACPVCKRELSSLGTGNLIKPFWSRLRSFFVYPFYPGPLVVLLVLSIITFLIAQVPGWHVGVNFIFWRIPRNLLFIFPFLFVFFNYAQSVLEATANGHMKPRPLSSEQLTGNGLIVAQLFLLLFIFNLIEFAVLDLFGSAMHQFVILLLAFATPAAIMVLVMEDNIFSALNPVTVATVIMRIGAPYIVLIALFYFVLQSAFGSTLGILFNYIDPLLFAPVFAFVFMYFMLLAFNMMGYLLYQHHEELGFEIEVDVQEQAAGVTPALEVSPELRAVEIMIHEGKTEQAVNELVTLVRNSPSDTEVRERLLKLARLTGNIPLHAEQGQAYISYLLGEKRLAQAAKVFQASYEYDKAFRPAKPAQRLELAEFLRQNNQPRMALALVNNLHKDFPNFEGIPDAYLMVAQLLCEKFNEDVRARQVLEFILKNYASHPQAGAAREYLKIIDGLSSRQG